MKKEGGQVVIILLLIVVLALSIALSIAGRSINEISTAGKTENSTRAFTAAEAGIERASTLLQQGPTPVVLNLGNDSSAIVERFDIPRYKEALEYPPIGKESFAQFWLADPEEISSGVPALYYNQGSFDIYFGSKQDYLGDNQKDQPAIQVNLVLWNSSTEKYELKKYPFDSYPTRPDNNNFLSCSKNPPAILVQDKSREFYCKATISNYGTPDTVYPVLARVRILYSSISHPVAIVPTGTDSTNCPEGSERNCSFPPQAYIYRAKGTSGDAQRTIEVFKQKNVMPQFFDYALFSAGELSK